MKRVQYHRGRRVVAGLDARSRNAILETRQWQRMLENSGEGWIGVGRVGLMEDRWERETNVQSVGKGNECTIGGKRNRMCGETGANARNTSLKWCRTDNVFFERKKKLSYLHTLFFGLSVMIYILFFELRVNALIPSLLMLSHSLESTQLGLKADSLICGGGVEM